MAKIKSSEALERLQTLNRHFLENPRSAMSARDIRHFLIHGKPVPQVGHDLPQESFSDLSTAMGHAFAAMQVNRQQTGDIYKQLLQILPDLLPQAGEERLSRALRTEMKLRRFGKYCLKQAGMQEMEFLAIKAYKPYRFARLDKSRYSFGAQNDYTLDYKPCTALTENQRAWMKNLGETGLSHIMQSKTSSGNYVKATRSIAKQMINVPDSLDVGSSRGRHFAMASNLIDLQVSFKASKHLPERRWRMATHADFSPMDAKGLDEAEKQAITTLNMDQMVSGFEKATQGSDLIEHRSKRFHPQRLVLSKSMLNTDLWPDLDHENQMFAYKQQAAEALTGQYKDLIIATPIYTANGTRTRSAAQRRAHNEKQLLPVISNLAHVMGYELETFAGNHGDLLAALEELTGASTYQEAMVQAKVVMEHLQTTKGLDPKTQACWLLGMQALGEYANCDDCPDSDKSKTPTQSALISMASASIMGDQVLLDTQCKSGKDRTYLDVCYTLAFMQMSHESGEVVDLSDELAQEQVAERFCQIYSSGLGNQHPHQDNSGSADLKSMANLPAFVQKAMKAHGYLQEAQVIAERNYVKETLARKQTRWQSGQAIRQLRYHRIKRARIRVAPLPRGQSGLARRRADRRKMQLTRLEKLNEWILMHPRWQVSNRDMLRYLRFGGDLSRLHGDAVAHESYSDLATVMGHAYASMQHLPKEADAIYRDLLETAEKVLPKEGESRSARVKRTEKKLRQFGRRCIKKTGMSEAEFLAMKAYKPFRFSRLQTCEFTLGEGRKGTYQLEYHPHLKLSEQQRAWMVKQGKRGLINLLTTKSSSKAFVRAARSIARQAVDSPEDWDVGSSKGRHFAMSSNLIDLRFKMPLGGHFQGRSLRLATHSDFSPMDAKGTNYDSRAEITYLNMAQMVDAFAQSSEAYSPKSETLQGHYFRFSPQRLLLSRSMLNLQPFPDLENECEMASLKVHAVARLNQAYEGHNLLIVSPVFTANSTRAHAVKARKLHNEREMLPVMKNMAERIGHYLLGREGGCDDCDLLERLSNVRFQEGFTEAREALADIRDTLQDMRDDRMLGQFCKGLEALEALSVYEQMPDSDKCKSPMQSALWGVAVHCLFDDQALLATHCKSGQDRTYVDVCLQVALFRMIDTHGGFPDLSQAKDQQELAACFCDAYDSGLGNLHPQQDNTGAADLKGLDNLPGFILNEMKQRELYQQAKSVAGRNYVNSAKDRVKKSYLQDPLAKGVRQLGMFRKEAAKRPKPLFQAKTSAFRRRPN